MDYFTVLLSIVTIVALIYAIYRLLFKKKTSQPTMYTPYDDFTRGTNDTNSHINLEEDSRHAVEFEVVSKHDDRKDAD